jgi:hypothetical protein
MIAVILGIVTSVVAFLIKFFLRGALTKSPAQEALKKQQQMAQVIADTPDKSQAIKDLENGNA